MCVSEDVCVSVRMCGVSEGVCVSVRTCMSVVRATHSGPTQF